MNLNFSITVDEQVIPIQASGVVQGYCLASEDIVWEGLLRGNVDVNNLNFKVLVGFIKRDSSSDIQANVTLQPSNEEVDLDLM